MFVTNRRGALVSGERVPLGEVCWIPLLPPDRPGDLTVHFFATLDSGATRTKGLSADYRRPAGRDLGEIQTSERLPPGAQHGMFLDMTKKQAEAR